MHEVLPRIKGTGWRPNPRGYLGQHVRPSAWRGRPKKEVPPHIAPALWADARKVMVWGA